MQIKKYILIISCIILPVSNGIAQIKSIGTYSVVNYSETENEILAATNSIIQDKRGIVLFGNNKGVVLFDGINWQLLKLPNNAIVYSLAMDSTGIVYVGAMDEFGYLKSSENGEIHYVSLLPELPSVYGSSGNVTAIFPLPEGILFITNNKLMLYRNNKCEIVQQDSINGEAFKFNGHILIKENLRTYKVFKDGKLSLFKGMGQFNCENTHALINRGNNSIWAIDNLKGCLEFNKDKISRLKTDFTDFVLKNKITASLTMKNGFTVLGSMNNGAVIIDTNGLIVQHINKNNGLENNHIISLYEDNCGNLWFGHDNGASSVQISSPFTNLEVEEHGRGYAAIIFDSKLYIGTSQGLYVSSWIKDNSGITKDKFIPVDNISGDTYNLTTINHKLYASNSSGTYLIDNTTAEKIYTGTGTWAFKALPYHPGYYLQGTFSGFALFIDNGRGLEFARQLKGFNKPCRVFEMDKHGFIWVSHGYQGVYRLKINPGTDSLEDIRFYGKANGFPSNLGINVYKIRNTLLFTSEHGGIYEYSYAKDTFLLNTDFAPYLGKFPNISKLFEDQSGNIYVVELDHTGVLINKGNGNYSSPEQNLADLNKKQIRGFEFIYPIDSNNIIFGTTKGFLHFNPAINKDYNTPYLAVIRKVEIIKVRDSTVYYGFKPDKFLTENIKKIFPHRFNSLRFAYAAPYYENNGEIRFSCYLEGFEDNWSDWSAKNIREYTNLPGGKYVFHVKAKNIYGVESREDAYTFYVKPPITKTWLAFALYLIAFMSLVKGLVVFISKEKIAKYKRESLIKEREIINLKNQQLNSEIEFKNKELGSMTMQMIKRNEILLNIKNKLDEIYNNGLSSEAKNSVYLIIKAIDNDVNSVQDWEFLQVNFDNVYTGFIKKLKELFPDLHASELQLCAYIRMGLSNKEIATLMNSTTRGIEGYRYRLRKNLALEHDENIKDFLFNLM